MQTAVAVSPPTNGAVAARARSPSRKRSRPKPAVVAAPVEPSIQPSPKVLRYQAVIRAALKNPPLAPGAVSIVRRRIAKMDLTLLEAKEIVDILVSVTNEGAQYQPVWGKILTPTEARERIVQPFGVSREAYWEAAWLALRAIISEAGRRQPKDLKSVWLRLDIVTTWPGALPEKELGPVLGRLTTDLRRILSGRISWYPAG